MGEGRDGREVGPLGLRKKREGKDWLLFVGCRTDCDRHLAPKTIGEGGIRRRHLEMLKDIRLTTLNLEMLEDIRLTILNLDLLEDIKLTTLNLETLEDIRLNTF